MFLVQNKKRKRESCEDIPKVLVNCLLFCCVAAPAAAQNKIVTKTPEGLREESTYSIIPFAFYNELLQFAAGGAVSAQGVLVGASLGVALTPKVHWNTSLDAGFGGSNGTYNFTSGISWRFWKYMSIGPNFSFMAIDFENGEIGDSDWYLYDANEFGWGASFMIHLK